MQDNEYKYPSYWGLLPATVRYDNNLSSMQKIMYTEITALQNAKGVCFATNQYFSKLYGVHKNTVGKWINELEKKGYIKSKLIYKNNTKQILKRLLSTCSHPINEKIDTYQLKDVYPINENIEDNNTSNNKEEEEIKKKKEQLSFELIHKSIDLEMVRAEFNYLNDKDFTKIHQRVYEFTEYCLENKKIYKDYTQSFFRYLEIAKQNNWNF